MLNKLKNIHYKLCIKYNIYRKLFFVSNTKIVHRMFQNNFANGIKISKNKD
jgi:hypothetical protein